MSVVVCLTMALLLATSIRCQCTNRDCGGETCETSPRVTQLLETSLLQQEERNKQLQQLALQQQQLSEKVDRVIVSYVWFLLIITTNLSSWILTSK